MLVLELDTQRNKLYVDNFGDGTVSVINTSSGEITKTVTVGTFPLGVTTDSDTDTTLVANRTDGTVSVLRG
ncbi:YncE family protein [Streptomyces sp. NPDC003247]|uniref:YncE family protein n=1 Tax=Streptomyces sp. NPDC003247 TaxID=3364677 RepID=UPI0036C8C4CA